MATFLTRPLLDIRPTFDQVKIGQLDDFTFDATGQARATPWKITSGPRRTISYDFLFPTRAAMGAFRRFAGARSGRLDGFWLPVYLRDYELTQDQAAGDLTLTVKKLGLGSALGSFAQFKALVLANWEAIEPYEIDSVMTSGENEVITLTSGLVAGLDRSTKICGGLVYARFSDDALSYAFRDLGVSRLQVDFEELPAEIDTADVGSAPVYLYTLSRAGQVWRYVNWGVDLVIAGNTWTAADINHAGLKYNIEFTDEGPSLTIGTNDANHPLRALLDRYLLQQTTLTIYESDAVTLAAPSGAVYTGRIDDVTFEKRGRIRASPTSLLWMAEQQGPRLALQRVCAHQTYDGYCGLNAADFTTSGTISAVSSSPASVDASAFGTKASAESDPNWFALGLVTSGNEKRFCVGQSGNTLYLNAPFKFAQVGDAISALAGDDKRIATCQGKFNNVDQFFGMPYAPNKNPQFEALQTPKNTGGKKG